MAIIENLDIVLGARTEKLDSGLDRSTGRVKKFESDVGGIGRAAEATMAPLLQIGQGILASIPGASAAATAFAAIAAAFATSKAAKVAADTAATATTTSAAATSMTAFATAAAAAAVATHRVRDNVTDLPRIDDKSLLPRIGNGRPNNAIAPYNPATARAGKGVLGDGDVIDAEFKVISSKAIGTQAALGGISTVGVAAGAAVAAAFVAIGVGIVATMKLIAGVREQMDEIDQAADAAKRLGFEYSQLVQLRMAIGRSTGMDDSQIDAALSKMQLNLEAARSGSGALAEQLKSLGLDAGQLLQAGPVEAMKQISAAAQQMKSPVDQNRLAFDLAGKSGVALAQSLRDGPEAIDEAATKAKQLGLTLSQAQTEQVGAANDAWEDMQLIATGVFRQIAAEVSPVITAISTSITDIGMSFGGWQSALPTIVDNTVLFTGAVYDAYELVTGVYTTLYKLSNLDFSGAGETIKSALDVSTGVNMLAKVQEARDAAAAAAKNPIAGELDTDALQAERDAQKSVADAAKSAADQKAADDARNKNAVIDRIQGLRDELATVKDGAEAFDRLKLARLGASAAQIAEFKALQDQKKQADEAAQLMERGKQMMEDFRTPQEQFVTKMKDLDTLLNVGAIDFQTYARAARDSANQFGKSDMNTPPQSPSVGALQKGSVEAYSAGLKNDGAAKQANLQEKNNTLLQGVEKHLEQMNLKFGNLITIGKA